MGRGAIPLFTLMALAPFEPRFAFPLGPVSVTMLELVAAACVIGLLRRDAFAATRDTVIGALTVFCLVAIASAALSGDGAPDSLRFAMRFVAMTVFAAVVSRVDGVTARAGVVGVAAGALVAAALAILEGLRVREVDLVLGVFREQSFAVAGVRRATAGSEYPNLGAAMIAYGVLAVATLARERTALRSTLVAAMGLGLAFTHSRGSAVACVLALGVLALWTRGRAGLLDAVVMTGALATFVGTEEIARIRLGDERMGDAYRARYEVDAEVHARPGERVRVPVRLTNTGRRSWALVDRFNLSYHLLGTSARPLLDGPRSRLTRDISPGDSLTVDAEIAVPAREGRYLVLWDLVQENTTWFSGQGVAPGVTVLDVSATATSAEARSTVAPPSADEVAALVGELAWRPGRLDLWSIAARMWAAHPFFGVGPDNYRRTYGTWAGRDVFDTRVYANSLYLELAATLGTTGLAAFLAALAFAFARLRPRGAEDSAAVAFGLLAVVTLHGLVDYTLAFTGHYLVAGLAFGIAARSAPVADVTGSNARKDTE